ncbi:MAG TPA: carbamoyltransferase N-terminal domain-containing protein, partial [Verrucomicrobiae bacterium]|nr:carbamoyltransferase N-terminal domain-containing protein [Verrucomicrobiae bacterium]
MLILGLNAYHPDAAACVLRDGRLLAAVEEERFRRAKHWAGLPIQAVKYCLDEAGATLADVDHLAVNRRPGAASLRRLAYLLSHRPAFGLIWERLRRACGTHSIVGELRGAMGGQDFHAQFHPVEHHLAHLASAFMVSDFQKAVCVSMDGFGDFASAAWGLGHGQDIVIDGRIFFPHSLGIFYSAITQYLGFPGFGDEYKVMGLAAYGQPRFLSQMRQLVSIQPHGGFLLNLRFFCHHTRNVNFGWDGGVPRIGCMWTPELEQLLGPARRPGAPLRTEHQDIACSAQAMYEETLFLFLRRLHQKYRCANLALSGGCALNSVANGKITSNSPFQRVYVPAAAGDAGGAVGAALLVWQQVKGDGRGADGRERSAVRPCQSGQACFGPEFSN